jgi:drug/metabolite transporter (DMT)-like permease
MRHDLRLGARHALYAALAFALTGVCVKAASASLPNEVVVFVRCAVALIALTPWVLHQGVRTAIATRRWGGHLVRAGFGVCAMYCFFYAIKHLHLAEAMLLTYSTPLWIPFIAWAWIGERPPWLVFPAIAIGLLGIGFIVQPGQHAVPPLAALVGVASGLFAACAMVGIRRISDTEPAPRIVFYFALLSTAITAVPLAWAWVMPDLRGWSLLIGAGLLATVGQLNLTRAYACAPAALIGPFTYLSVVFSAGLAWLIWDEALNRGSFIGIAQAQASGTAVIAVESRAK